MSIYQISKPDNGKEIYADQVISDVFSAKFLALSTVYGAFPTPYPAVGGNSNIRVQVTNVPALTPGSHDRFQLHLLLRTVSGDNTTDRIPSIIIEDLGSVTEATRGLLVVNIFAVQYEDGFCDVIVRNVSTTETWPGGTLRFHCRTM